MKREKRKKKMMFDDFLFNNRKGSNKYTQDLVSKDEYRLLLQGVEEIYANIKICREDKKLGFSGLIISLCEMTNQFKTA